MEMCRPGVGTVNPLFYLWRVLRHPTAPASRIKSRRTAEESRTRSMIVDTLLIGAYSNKGVASFKIS
jgi:hypothetical protein